MRAGIAATIVTFAMSILAGCGGRSRPKRHLVERARAAMGSELRLTAWTADEVSALAAFDAVFAEFERLDALMSVWRPGSDVLRLNAAAGDRPVALQPDVIEVLTIARQVSEWTDGTFAVTFGALSDLWRFDHDQDNTIPHPALVRAPPTNAPASSAYLNRIPIRSTLGRIGRGSPVDPAAARVSSRATTDC